MNTVIIGIGSNIEPDKNVALALTALLQFGLVEKTSTFIKTAPIGIVNQPEFTNGAVKIGTLLSKDELNAALKNIENQLGRDRTASKFGPRTIDLDIVVWNGQIVDLEYYTRDFLYNSVSELM